MNGDFSRDTSGPARLARYTRVLLQQGRPLLDADFNEQGAIHHDFMRTLTVDPMGRGWRPGVKQFSILGFLTKVHGFPISNGHFHVDGILCDYPADCTFVDQPFLQGLDVPGDSFIAYIERWERHLCAVQRPGLREIALGGPDTASRAQIVWQVRAATAAWAKAQEKQVDAALGVRIAATKPSETAALKTLNALKASLLTTTSAFSKAIDSTSPLPKDFDDPSHQWFDALKSASPGLRAMAKRDASDNEACSISPDSIYRGRENQLYRVEIHEGGTLADGGKPTFKWSRENGSVLFAVRVGEDIVGVSDPAGMVTLTIPLETMGHDRRTGICAGDWVEVTSDGFEFAGLAPPLGQVKQVDRTRRTVLVEMVEDKSISFGKCSVLRRWDQTKNLDAKGTVPIIEASDTKPAMDAIGTRRTDPVPARRRVPNRRLLADPGPGRERRRAMAAA